MSILNCVKKKRSKSSSSSSSRGSSISGWGSGSDTYIYIKAEFFFKGLSSLVGHALVCCI